MIRIFYIAKQNEYLTEAYYYILLSLFIPRHGYGIKKYIEVLAKQRVELSAGTLYGAINSLLKKKYICRFTIEDDNRKYYIITDKGNTILKKELNRIKKLVQDGDNELTNDRIHYSTK